MFSKSITTLTLFAATLSNIHLATAQASCTNSANATILIMSSSNSTVGDNYNCTNLPGTFTGDGSISAAANYVSYLRINDKASCQYDSCTANCNVTATGDGGSPSKAKAEEDVQSFCSQLTGTFEG